MSVRKGRGRELRGGVRKRVGGVPVFYQVDGMEKPKGSGLGLAIVRDLSHLLKGKLRWTANTEKDPPLPSFYPIGFPPEKDPKGKRPERRP